MSQRQNVTPVSYVFVLPRCTVALYNDDGAGAPNGAAIWTGKSVENVRISEEYRIERRYVTGEPYIQEHATEERHEISFDAIWNTAAVLGRGTYVLVITWRDAGLGTTDVTTITRTYIGVQTPRREVSSREGNEFTSSHNFTATHYTELTAILAD